MYQQRGKIDICKFLPVYPIAVVVVLVMTVPVLFFVPFSVMYSWKKLLVFLSGAVVYYVIRQTLRGVFMKASGADVQVRGIVSSRAYFHKNRYILIATAPLFLLGIILALINLAVPADWFWPVYLIQAVNFAISVKDIYVTARISRLSGDLYVCDAGRSITILEREQDDRV